MVKPAIALGDRCPSRAAMNGPAAVVSAIILDELEHVSAHHRLSGHAAEGAVRTDIHRKPAVILPECILSLKTRIRLSASPVRTGSNGKKQREIAMLSGATT
jgi:hypothetical protein